MEYTLKIYSNEFSSLIDTYLKRTLRYDNSKISLSYLFSLVNEKLHEFMMRNAIYTLEKIVEYFFNSNERKTLYYPKGTYPRTILTLFDEITFTKRAYVDKNGNNHFYYLDSLLNISPRVVLDNDVINELLFLVGKHSSYAQASQILGNYIFKHLSVSDSDKYLSRATVSNYIKRTDIEEFSLLK